MGRLLADGRPPAPWRMSDARIHDLLTHEANGGRILDVGSGAWRRAPRVVNLDVVAQPTVDVIADAQNLPFRSETFDFVCCSSALEHLLCPEKVVAEIHRALRPGGRIFVEIPFVYPFHGDDATGEADYRRMTAAGLRHILRDFAEIETGQSVGPAGVLSLLAAEFVALFFASRSHTVVYYSVRNLVGWLFVPLRLLDPWLIRRPKGDRRDRGHVDPSVPAGHAAAGAVAADARGFGDGPH